MTHRDDNNPVDFLLIAGDNQTHTLGRISSTVFENPVNL